MSKLIDLTGQKFNRLTVLKRAESENGQTRWECRCDCGNITIVRASNLKNGSVKSCGCLLKEPTNKMHGESQSKLYRMWRSLIYRCENPKDIAYKYYGARGIKVCDEWHDFMKFKKWVSKTKYNDDYTIERKDVNGNYCPANCTWANSKQQANNRRSNVMIDYKGETHNLSEWCALLDLDYKNVHNRMWKLGWSFDKAVSTPIDKSKRNKVERDKIGRIHE